jgi:hypothetical protein
MVVGVGGGIVGGTTIIGATGGATLAGNSLCFLGTGGPMT